MAISELAPDLFIGCDAFTRQLTMIASQTTNTACDQCCVEQHGYGDQVLRVPLIVTFLTVELPFEEEDINYGCQD